MDTHETLGRFCNWGIERWNHARYSVMPMMGAYGLEEPSVEASREAIGLWEELIGVWENDDGEIVGAVTTEYPKRGDVFFQRPLPASRSRSGTPAPAKFYARANLEWSDEPGVWMRTRQKC